MFTVILVLLVVITRISGYPDLQEIYYHDISYTIESAVNASVCCPPDRLQCFSNEDSLSDYDELSDADDRNKDQNGLKRRLVYIKACMGIKVSQIGHEILSTFS